jgi:phosphoribosylglycinamide formyltransferase-1
MSPELRGRRVKLGILIGNGGRLKSIWKGTQHLTALSELAVVVSFKKQSPGIEWAQKMNIPAYTLRWTEFKEAGKSREEFDTHLASILIGHGVELVVIAGWGLLLTRGFLEVFPNRIINVHPALLTDTLQETKIRTHGEEYIPVFRGNHALEQALGAGVETTGCTVHYVTEEMDVGPVILRREVAIRPGDDLDTLAERVHAAEDEILPQAIEEVCTSIMGLEPGG